MSQRFDVSEAALAFGQGYAARSAHGRNPVGPCPAVQATVMGQEGHARLRRDGPAWRAPQPRWRGRKS